MELSSQKRMKICKRKRLAKNRRRNQRKVEVRSAKRRKMACNISTSISECMDFPIITAKTFWENYEIAQDWQQRHNVAWWRSRCIALEHENAILRNKLRELADYRNNTEGESIESVDECNVNSQDDRNLEFHVNEEMISFLEQSIRHKNELKKIRESEKLEASTLDNNECSAPVKTVKNHEIIENARQLYGASASRIIAMETSLQVTIDYHKDRAKPHYWPIIPLNPLTD